MTIEWKTKNINIQNYYKIIRRVVILSAGYNFWRIFKNEWKITVLPVDQAGDYSEFYGHLLTIETSTGIAWGITGKKEMVLFVVDSRNPFIIRSNAMVIGHELLHAIFQSEVGTSHIRRQMDGAPEGRIGTMGAAATVIVHDIWYGTKETLTLWISWGLGWLPITVPFITIKEAKRRYGL